MFQRFIYNFIRRLKKLYDKLDMAYERTYTDSTISPMLNQEIENRKVKNKANSIKKIKQAIKESFKRQFNQRLDDKMAELFANDFYKIAKDRGEIDELGNFTGEIKFK